ncbi:MAG: AAA family ATPase [Acidobacteriota bacterium]|nr:AAA family ATPase [Acidobacteriota bacterium]
MNQPIRILHLSDFQFRSETSAAHRLALDTLIESIEKEVAGGRAPDLVAVTGDIAYSGREEEYRVALEFIENKLWPLFGDLPLDHLLLVPGNHDADLHRISPLVRSMESVLLDDSSTYALQRLTPLEKRVFFDRFTDYSGFARTVTEQPHREPYWHCRIDLRGVRLGVVGLCSSWMSGGAKGTDWMIGSHQLNQHLNPVVDSDLVIALVHHPSEYWWSPDRYETWPLIEHRCALVLTGYSERENSLSLHQAGRTCVQLSNSGPTREPFHLIEIDPYSMELTVHMHRLVSPGKLKAITSAPILLKGRKPVSANASVSAEDESPAMGPSRRFHIGSFRSIPEQDIELGVVNVLIGANGSGKSNILEALGVLGAAASGRVDDTSLSRAGVRLGVPRLYQSAFAGMSAPAEIQFGLEVENARYGLTLYHRKQPETMWRYKMEDFQSFGQSVAERDANGGKDDTYGLSQKVLPDLSPRDPLRLCLEALRDYAVFSPNTQVMRGLVQDMQSRSPMGLSGGRLAEAVEEVRAQIGGDDDAMELWEDLLGLVDWMADLDAADSVSDILSGAVPRAKKVLRFTDRFMDKEKNTLTGYDASEGALYVLYFAVLALHPQAPKWLAVDNADQALNPRLVQGLLKCLCDWLPRFARDRCLLMTLHNPSALDGLPLKDDRVRLFTVSRNNKGHTVVQRVVYTEELARFAEEKDLPLSRLWVMGHLGGVPDVI